jgi:hypothetical protein
MYTPSHTPLLKLRIKRIRQWTLILKRKKRVIKGYFEKLRESRDLEKKDFEKERL